MKLLMQGSSIFPEEAIRRVYNSKLDVLEDYLIGLSLNNENLLRCYRLAS